MTALIEIRTHKQPLPTTEMTRASHRENVLIETADSGAQPALSSAAQVSGGAV
jgi:hypothetical protein